MFADRNYDTGSGDLYDGDYTLTISLKDFVATTKLYDGSAFSAGAIVDGKLTFAGVQVYSVNGAAVTVKTLAIESEVVEEEEEKPVTPPTGDASLLVFVLIGLVSLAGVSFAAKAHKEF
jgi:hypothetical protein